MHPTHGFLYHLLKYKVKMQSLKLSRTLSPKYYLKTSLFSYT